jgi:hypothetical protein
MSEQPAPVEARQFDFWLGKWEAVWGDDQHGRNVVTSILNDNVILENFNGQPGMDFAGMSVSVFNRRTGNWQQTWVDSEAGYLDFVGAFNDGRMILQRTAEVEGRRLWQRMVWHNIDRDQFDWNWERSDDDGQTWQVMWHIHYTRRVLT